MRGVAALSIGVLLAIGLVVPPARVEGDGGSGGGAGAGKSAEAARAEKPRWTEAGDLEPGWQERLVAGLVARGLHDLDDAGRPKATRLALDFQYAKSQQRTGPNGRRQKSNLYVTTAEVALPHPPEEVIALATDLASYDRWAVAGLNDRAIHPRGEAWETDILSMGGDRRGDLVVKARVLGFAEGTLALAERRRESGGAGAPSVYHLSLRTGNVLVSYFTITFFVVPVAGGRASAIRFESECGLARALDWWYRQRERDPSVLLRPRVQRFLENFLAELERRHPSAPPAAPAPSAPPAAAEPY